MIPVAGRAPPPPRRPPPAARARTGAPSRAAGSARPDLARSAITSDWSTSEPSRSSTPSRPSPSPAQTCSTASRVKPPANTARRRSSVCSSAESRSWLQSSDARRVWWRSQCGARPAGEQAEAVRETARDLLDREHPQACRRQLDRERYPVQLAAQSGHRLDVLIGEGEAGTHLARRARRTAPPRQNRRAPRPPRQEATGAEPASRSRRRRRAARGWSPARRPRDSLQKRLGDLGARLEQVLAVVEHDQRPPRGEIGADGLKLGEARQRPHPQGLRHRRRDQPLLGERREVDPPDAVGEAIRELRGAPQRQSGLAAASGTRQGQQPGSRQLLA